MTETSSSLINLTEYDSSTTVIYVESLFSKEINDFIQSNFIDIAEVFRKHDLNFIYLPLLLINEEYQQVVDYNYPYLNLNLQDLRTDDVYRIILEKYDLTFSGSALIAIDSGYSDEIVDFQPIKAKDDIFCQFISFIEFTNTNIIEKYYDHTYPLFNLGSPVCKEVDDISLYYDDSILEAEILNNIQKLKEKGSLLIIANILNKIKEIEQKLSRIFITYDYRIFLSDYNMKEVVMSPLPKSLFFLFLKYPEGIPFKHLTDYEDELLSIYRNITTYDDIEQSKLSIKALTSPLGNSVNENCSRIRAAFLKVVSDKIAQNYYITGYRGDPKKIKIDRQLVIYQ